MADLMVGGRDRLVEEAFRLKAVSRWEQVGPPLPLVPIALFFCGNDDISSLGCNLISHPGIRRFEEVLERVRARADVQDVLVEINEITSAQSEWPFADTIYIVTSADHSDIVEDWLDEISPSDVGDVDLDEFQAKPGAVTVMGGMKAVAVFWD